MNEKKEFKIRTNMATVVFLVALVLVFVYYTYLMINGLLDMASYIAYIIFMVGSFYVFEGYFACKYIVDNKEVIKVRRLAPNSKMDLVHCEVICDPVKHLWDIITRPHGVEIYDDAQKREIYYPRDIIGFTDAVVKSNRRIHCTVHEYTDIHRSIEKRERKARRREERRRRG